MKLGLIARADNSGLGIQTHEFYRHMQPDKTMVVDISMYNHNRTFEKQRYPNNAFYLKGFPNAPEIYDFLKGLDVVFIAESAYSPQVYRIAKELGVKTAVQYNYEFMDWLVNPNFPKPDMLIAPSMWHFNDVQKWCDENGVKHIYLHCPVNRDLLPARKIKQARTFLHMAGKAAAHDRNGTITVIEAAKFLKTDARIVVHFQGEQGLPHQATTNIDEYRMLLEDGNDVGNITILQREFVEYQHIYAMGDVLLLPRRYGGNCLPLNEALSVGMPVVMTDVSPNNEFLPSSWLLPAKIVGQFEPRTLIDIYESDPVDLAAKIDEFYNMSEEEFTSHHNHAKSMAQAISWGHMKANYKHVLEQLCNSQ